MKAILITGSTQGIGFGVARYYASRDYHVCLNYVRNTKVAEKALRELTDSGASVSLHRCDVRDEASVTQMFQEIALLGHQVETVVNNAVDEIPKPIDEATFDEWHQVLLTKLDGAFLVTKYAIKALQGANDPAIVFITSSEGWKPDGEYLAYQVGTAGLIAMMIGNSRYLAKKFGIRVNAVAPGPVRSGLWDKAGQNDEMWQAFEARSPVGRVSNVDDIAAAVWFLAEDPRKFLNGTTINVDGGSQWV